jgi:hypothetical protein
MGSSGRTVHHPWLGLSQPDCIGPRALIIEPSGGGKRRRSRRVPHHGSHRPCWGTSDLQDGVHHHWSKGPTPRTTGASDRAVPTAFTDLAVPSCTTSAATDASIHQSRPVELRYATGSIESVRQPSAPVIRTLRRPIWQRPCTRVLELNCWAKSLSDGDGRRGVTPREVEEQERFDAGGVDLVEEQQGEFKI